MSDHDTPEVGSEQTAGERVLPPDVAEVRCVDLKNEVPHPSHWHVVRSSNVTWAQGVCPGFAAPVPDHPGTDPGDGRTQCATCGKWVWLVTHSCKGVRVHPPASPVPVQPADAGEGRQIVLGQIGEHVEPTELSEAEVGEIGRAMNKAAKVWVPTTVLVVVEHILAARDAEHADRLAAVEAERDDLDLRLSTLLCDLTGGLMSKTNYSVVTMAQAIEAEFEKYATAGAAEIVARAESAETERDTALREVAERDARLAKVEALADEWSRDGEHVGSTPAPHDYARALRAALTNPDGGGQ